MAGINAAQVYMPGPNQSKTAGAISTADEGTTAPTDARTTLGADWTSGGYVTDAGVTMNITRSTSAVKEWGQSVVRKPLSDFDITFSIPFMQVDEFFAKEAFGASNVTKTAADSTHGNILEVAIGPALAEIKAWCIDMIDGDRYVRAYVPRGQITELGNVPFVPTAVNEYPSTLSCYDDGTGHSVYLIYDDGEVTSL